MLVAGTLRGAGHSCLLSARAIKRAVGTAI